MIRNQARASAPCPSWPSRLHFCSLHLASTSLIFCNYEPLGCEDWLTWMSQPALPSNAWVEVFLNTPFQEVGLPWWFSGKWIYPQCRRCRFHPWVRNIPWRREWQPILPWEIPWTEEPGGLQFMGSQETKLTLRSWSSKSVAKPFWLFCDPMDCSPSGSSVASLLPATAHCHLELGTSEMTLSSRVAITNCISSSRGGGFPFLHSVSSI